MNLESVLKYLVRHRNNDDLHSGMFYFESGRVAFIDARFDKSLCVTIYGAEKQFHCSTVKEVLSLFDGDSLIKYET